MPKALPARTRLVVDERGYATIARRVRSPNCDARPAGTEITLLVLHGISLPPGEFGGDGIVRLFTNRLDAARHPYYATIAKLRVSAHFLIRRDGSPPPVRVVQRAGMACGRVGVEGARALQ